MVIFAASGGRGIYICPIFHAKGRMLQQQESSASGGMVDLRLAVNYVPACVCFFKSVVLLAVLCCIHTAGSAACYVPVALALVLDRLYSSPVAIFDGNGVLLSLFFAHVVNHLREGELRSQLEAYYVFIVSPLCPLLAVLAVLDVPIPFIRRGGLAGLFCEMAFFISAMAFMSIDSESYVVRILRGLVFVMLSFAWAYIIGIHQRRMANPLDSSVHFAVYFSPVLYIHGFLALAFSGVALLCLVVLMHRDAAVLTVVRGAECGPLMTMGSKHDDDDDSSFIYGELRAHHAHHHHHHGHPPLYNDHGEESISEMEEAFRQAKALLAGPKVS